MNGPPHYLGSQDIPLSIDTRNKQTRMIAFKGVSFYGADKQVRRPKTTLVRRTNIWKLPALPRPRRPHEDIEGISFSIGLPGGRIFQLSLLTVPGC